MRAAAKADRELAAVTSLLVVCGPPLSLLERTQCVSPPLVRALLSPSTDTSHSRCLAARRHHTVAPSHPTHAPVAPIPSPTLSIHPPLHRVLHKPPPPSRRSHPHHYSTPARALLPQRTYTLLSPSPPPLPHLLHRHPFTMAAATFSSPDINFSCNKWADCSCAASGKQCECGNGCGCGSVTIGQVKDAMAKACPFSDCGSCGGGCKCGAACTCGGQKQKSNEQWVEWVKTKAAEACTCKTGGQCQCSAGACECGGKAC